MGVPGAWTETGLRLNTEGCIFWVDPNHPDPNDQRDGTDPTSPLATVGAALTHCEPYRGDVIAVMHNGFWTYGNMASAHIVPIREAVVVTVPGVRIVGVSTSSLGVPWTGTADNDVLITVRALDVLIEGFNFWERTYAGVTAVAAEWDSPPYGENLVIRHCYFYQTAYGITLDYSWNCYVEDCQFIGIGTAAIHNPSVYGEPDYLVIRDCTFRNNAADINLPDCDHVSIEGCRFFQTTSGIVMANGDYNQILNNTFSQIGTVAISLAGGDNNIIRDNCLQGLGAGANNMINLTGGANNLVCGNCLSCTIGQYDTTCSDATSGSWGGNHCSNGDTTAPPT